MEKEEIDTDVSSLLRIKWRNIVFDKSGKTYNGRTLWNSRQEAFTHAIYIERTMTGNVMKEDYSWVMQIPIMEN